MIQILHTSDIRPDSGVDWRVISAACYLNRFGDTYQYLKYLKALKNSAGNCRKLSGKTERLFFRLAEFVYVGVAARRLQCRARHQNDLLQILNI